MVTSHLLSKDLVSQEHLVSPQQGCAAASSSADATGAWVTVDLGYRGQFAAVGVDLGAADLTKLNLRVGNAAVNSGVENPLCIPTIANLPGYSKTLFGCTAAGRYLTVQAPSASALDLCLVSAFLQGAATSYLLAGSCAAMHSPATATSRPAMPVCLQNCMCK